MSGFRVVLTVEATLEAFAAKRWRLEHLGLERALELDDAIARALDRIQRFPRSGAPEEYHGRWSKLRRKVNLGKTRYVLRYRLHPKAELIEVFSIRHQKRRRPR